ncbi:oxidoreductase [Neoasaia chiangmaiensis NBRC 101099]|nr:SDR family oxidoreductase [Neoasaia chiangmaiensis]GBR37751.1 oxidoreductase [Neoasaia chiangmaiensis NBRC 101099]GEN15101.1 glucose-1-dehydrogenase [Neoasaia chiangmaiensis]
MEKNLVIVTGGARGIGRAIAEKLVQEGYAVAITYTSSSTRADEVVSRLQGEGGRIRAFQADVTNPAQIAKLFDDAISALGPLHGLVNNAGITGTQAPIADQTPEDLNKLIATNITGSLIAAGEAARRLSTEAGALGGVIINISSVAARLGGLSGLVAYATTKGAIETFTKGFANEVARNGIRVNAVAPGLTDTEMVPAEAAQAAEKYVPMGRMGEPSEIAEAVAFLLSDKASYITGTTLTVSGGR